MSNLNLQTDLLSGGVRFGYARVSTSGQDLRPQIESLKRVGCTEIYAEKASGKNANRPELEHLLRAQRKGDSLTVCSLDRLGRSLTDLLKIIPSLEEKGVHFESLKESINTNSATGRLMFHLFSCLSQFERDVIVERTKAGLAAARARGRKGGRRPKLNQSEAAQVKKLMEVRVLSVSQIAKRYQVSRQTLYNLVKTDAV